VTIVVDAESTPLEQIVGQLDKLVNVVAITDLAPKNAVERELLLATIKTDVDNRTSLLDIIADAGAAIIDVDATSVTVMLAGPPGAATIWSTRSKIIRSWSFIGRAGSHSLDLVKPTRPLSRPERKLVT